MNAYVSFRSLEIRKSTMDSLSLAPCFDTDTCIFLLPSQRVLVILDLCRPTNEVGHARTDIRVLFVTPWTFKNSGGTASHITHIGVFALCAIE
jgi:hypothetical protein